MSTVAPDMPCLLRVLVCSPAKESPAVEMRFERVRRLTLPFRTALQPSGDVRRDQVEFRFAAGDPPIRAERPPRPGRFAAHGAFTGSNLVYFPFPGEASRERQ